MDNFSHNEQDSHSGYLKEKGFVACTGVDGSRRWSSLDLSQFEGLPALLWPISIIMALPS